jgi:hypothetical protein
MKTGVLAGLAMVMLVATGCTAVQSKTEDHGKFTQNGQTYRHYVTTVTIERDPICTHSCAERP